MKNEEEVRKKLIEIQSDERLSYPNATIVENAPLALEQLRLETICQWLKWVLEEK